MRLIFSFFLLLITSFPAFAHSGHLGELAGHSHLVGWGLMIGAGLLAAAIARLKDNQDEISDEENSEEPDFEPEAA